MFTAALAIIQRGVGCSRLTVLMSPVLRAHGFITYGTGSFVPLVLTLLLASGCNEHADARTEAETLMSSLNAVSDMGTFTERSAALERLNRLHLHFATHVRTRDVCSAAHEGLLQAEVAQAQAKKALAGAGQEGSKQPIKQSQAQAIAAEIERSNRALATAKVRFPECEQAMRRLLREAH